MSITAPPPSGLLNVRERGICDTPCGLAGSAWRFLVSLAAAEPEWLLLDVDQLEQLPGIRLKRHIWMGSGRYIRIWHFLRPRGV